jgi:hypothetical protein
MDLRQTILNARQALGGVLDGQALDVMSEMQRQADAAAVLRERERTLVRSVVQDTGNRLGAASRSHFEQLAVDAAAKMLTAPSAGAPVAFDDFKPRPDALARARDLLSIPARASGQQAPNDYAQGLPSPDAGRPALAASPDQKQLPAPGQPKTGLLRTVRLLLAPPAREKGSAK